MGILKEMFRLNKEVGTYLLTLRVDESSLIFFPNLKVFVPSYREKKMVMLRVRDWNDVESLPLTKWNIKQPTDDGKREEALQNGGLDLILLPGVAFTKNGARLGHGMGYYDKYLNEMFDRFPGRRKLGSNHDISELIKQNQTLLFGLAFEEQILEEIPTEQWDVPLHAVISPS